MKRSLILVACLLLSPVTHAETTQGERDAYRVGVVTGAYVSYISALVDRLAAAGVPSDSISTVIDRSCRGIKLTDAVDYVLARKPVAVTIFDIVLQTHSLMDEACESLVGSSS